jgi:hypothetical protein
VSVSIEGRWAVGPGKAPGFPDLPVSVESGQPGVLPDRFGKYLEALGYSIDRGEALVARAMAGQGQLDAGQLIALQAGIYRYSEAVDLAAKLVDRAGSALRTTLQSGGG